jgi:hypothetical protein
MDSKLATKCLDVDHLLPPTAEKRESRRETDRRGEATMALSSYLSLSIISQHN